MNLHIKWDAEREVRLRQERDREDKKRVLQQLEDAWRVYQYPPHRPPRKES